MAASSNSPGPAQTRSPGSGHGVTSAGRVASDINEAAIKIEVLVLVLAAAYLIYGLMFSPGGSYTSLAPVDKQRVLLNFALGFRVLVWAASALAVSVAYRFYDEEATGYVLAVVGAAAHWGMPLVAGALVPAQGYELIGMMQSAGQRIGFFYLVPGGLVILYDLLYRVRESWSGRRKNLAVKAPKEALLLSSSPIPWRCWQTSYCRTYVRDLCPRYIERTPCWRRKEGCFCEEKIVFRALELKEEGGRVYSQMRELLGSAGRKSAVLTPKEKRDRCRLCPIYAQHQRFKYKMAVPFTFPVTAALLWLGAEAIRKWLVLSVTVIDNLAARMSFGVGKAAAGSAVTKGIPAGMSDAASMEVIYWGFMIFLGIMMLTWLLRLVEWLLLKVQI